MWLFRIFIFSFVPVSLSGQELFPLNEPASNIPKGVLGIRAGTHIHYKYSRSGHREFARLMYGVLPTMTVMGTATFSNFHVKDFPDDLNLYFRNHHNHKSKEVSYPYGFESVHLFTKWRFLTLDRQNEHLRLALYHEISYSTATHLDAFPTLMGDHSGTALGLISTKLYKKFAASLNSGLSTFFPYIRKENGDTVRFKAGNALNLNLSLGYLLFPRTYKSYRDINLNVYLEVQNRFFAPPVISRNRNIINNDQFKYLKGGYLSYVYPGIQLIFNSKTRVDASVELPLMTSNTLGRYAMLMINVQRYVY